MLPNLTSEGLLLVSDGGAPVTWNSGFGYDVDGRLCTTTTASASDVWLGGFRLSTVGQVVTGPGEVAARPYAFNNGIPFDKRDGRMIVQASQSPAATDPFVHGWRVGATGGVYIELAFSGALYNYEENAATPPAGSIYHSTGANSLKINVVDANGVDHTTAIQSLRAGDQITIGTQSAYLTGTPGITTGVALVLVDSWPNYTNGQYAVTIVKGVLPYTTVPPVISGSNLIGSTLTCTPGTWAGSPTPVVTRQWHANLLSIPGQTGLTYVTQAGDAGKNISCLESGTSLTGTTHVDSNQIFAGQVPTNIDAPSVTGEGTPGQTLTCGTGTWEADPAATYTKQWRADAVNISGQTANTYVVQAGDVGKAITCAVTATNTISAVTAVSNGILVTAAVGNPPVNTVAPVISGTNTVGSILSLTSQGTWTGTPPINYTYQWQRDGANTGNTGNSYVVQSGDAGLTITCRVTGTNVDGVAHASSNGILISAAAPFSPADLFVGGEQGAWYDPSDLSTMFQDSAGTAPVTADGQPVGKILDKSGRGNHASQATAAARPLYKTDGTYHWLQFDGVDDGIGTISKVSASSQNTIFVGGRWKEGANLVTLTDLGKWAVLTSEGAAGTANSDPESTFRANAVSVLGSPSTTRGQLYTAIASDTQTKVVTSTKANISSWAKLSITGYGGAYNSAFRCHSLIILGRLATPQEITDTETWVNGKTGAY